MARDLKIFYLFRLLATSYLWQPVLVFFMMSRGLGWHDIMALSAIYSGVVILIEVPTGAFADRIGRRQSMRLGALAMAVSCLTAYWAHDFSVFLLAEIFAAGSMALCSGADSAYLFDLLSHNGSAEQYPRRESKASAWHLVGSSVACVGGGFLGEVDLSYPYLATAIVAILAFFVTFAMGPDRTPRRRGRGAMTAEFRAYLGLMADAFRKAVGNRRLLWVLLCSATIFALLRVTIYLYQPYLDARGFAIWQTGLVFGGVYLVAAAVAHGADSLRRLVGERVLVWGLLGTLATSFLLLHQIAGPLALSLMAVQAATKGLYSPLLKPIVNREIADSGRRATMLSVESIFRRVATGVVSMIALYYGAHTAIYSCGALGVFGLIVLGVTSRYSPMLPRGGRALPSAEPVAIRDPAAVAAASQLAEAVLPSSTSARATGR